MADNTNTTLTIRNTAALVGITSTLLLSGTNLASSHLFLPLLYKLPVGASAKMFDKLYHNGMRAVVPMAAVAIASFGTAGYHSSPSASPPLLISKAVLSVSPRAAFAVAAGMVVATLAWTRVVIMPVNRRLVSISREVGAKDRVGPEEVEGLLRQWWWMNYVRGFGALAAGLVALGASL